MPLHTDREYEAELSALRQGLSTMAERVTTLLARSVRALLARDADALQALVHNDDAIDRLEMEIDELCVRVLARRQPVASDLRFITMTLKAVTDLERMGDHCVGLCHRALELVQEPPLSGALDLTPMADATLQMTRDAVRAFLTGDTLLAADVIARDAQVDGDYARIFTSLLDGMQRDPTSVARASTLQRIAKHLERLADHATNLAELAVYLVDARDIRHRPPQAH